MSNSIKNCFNTEDFRKLAKRKLPFPVFHYIDGAADDEVTLRRNTQAFEEVDLILISNFISGEIQIKNRNLKGD